MEAQEVMGLKIYPHKTDVNIAKASLVTGGGLSIAKKGFVAVAKKQLLWPPKQKLLLRLKFPMCLKSNTRGIKDIHCG